MKETKEIWKDIPNYEGYYQVSNLGRVKSVERKVNYYKNRQRLVRERLLKSHSLRGYERVVLCKKGLNKKNIQVHQLVAMAFLGHNPNGLKLVVDHINNIKNDNRLCNLQIITVRDNVIKSLKNGTSKYTGVSWCKRDEKWVSQISINGKGIFLGYFDDEYQAHLTYKNKLKSYKNEK